MKMSSLNKHRINALKRANAQAIKDVNRWLENYNQIRDNRAQYLEPDVEIASALAQATKYSRQSSQLEWEIALLEGRV